MKLDRLTNSVSVEKARSVKKRIELRIHSDNKQGRGSRYALLTGQEARLLAYSLLAEAERFG